MSRRKRNSQPEPRGVIWTEGDVTHAEVKRGHATIALIASTDRAFVENAVRFYSEPLRGRGHLAVVEGGGS